MNKLLWLLCYFTESFVSYHMRKLGKPNYIFVPIYARITRCMSKYRFFGNYAFWMQDVICMLVYLRCARGKRIRFYLFSSCDRYGNHLGYFMCFVINKPPKKTTVSENYHDCKLTRCSGTYLVSICVI